jgi:hypothetical protein
MIDKILDFTVKTLIVFGAGGLLLGLFFTLELLFGTNICH